MEPDAVKTSRSKRFDPWLDLEWGEHDEVRRLVVTGVEMTLEEIGVHMGLTRERVRQIEVIALMKLRTGVGLGEIIEVDGQTFPVVECKACSELFPREGRAKLCPECRKPRERLSDRRRPLESSVPPMPLDDPLFDLFETARAVNE